MSVILWEIREIVCIFGGNIKNCVENMGYCQADFRSNVGIVL